MDIPISELYRRAAEDWCDAEAAADLLRETKSAVLAEKMSAYGDIPVGRAENLVKATPEWRDHIGKIVAARKHANRLKIQVDYLKMKFYEQNSADAARRLEMRMTA